MQQSWNFRLLLASDILSRKLLSINSIRELKGNMLPEMFGRKCSYQRYFLMIPTCFILFLVPLVPRIGSMTIWLLYVQSSLSIWIITKHLWYILCVFKKKKKKKNTAGYIITNWWWSYFWSDFMKCVVVILDDELIGKDCVISMRICYSWHKGY